MKTDGSRNFIVFLTDLVAYDNVVFPQDVMSSFHPWLKGVMQ